MWTRFYNWWISNGTYTSIRNISELFYFIILTGAMVYYAAKSYRKSVEEKPELITHVYIDYKDRLKRGQNCYPMFLEIYNNGNGAAKNIILLTDSNKLTEGLSIFNTNLGFLQPQHSKFIPIGSLYMMLGKNSITIFNDIVEQDDLKSVKFYLQNDKKSMKEIIIDFDYVINMPKTPIGTNSYESIEEKTEKQLESINKSILKVKDAVDSLAKRIK